MAFIYTELPPKQCIISENNPRTTPLIVLQTSNSASCRFAGNCTAVNACSTGRHFGENCPCGVTVAQKSSTSCPFGHPFTQ